MNADPRDVIMERIRYCLDHDNPEGTTLVSWMADEIIASPAWQAAQGERAGLTAEDRRIMFDAVGMLSERYPLTAKDLREIIARLTGANPKGE